MLSHRAWCAKRKKSKVLTPSLTSHSPEHQWIQWDLGPPHKITGIITKGRGDSRRRHWVQSYTLTYSNDTVIWYTYKDTNHLDAKVVYPSNTRCLFHAEITVLYIGN
ncbi:hypothetical protein HAZT_HAZT010852 [Hyalella azteca]|uniref:F5/8 type C domain-containing protein n=1 Tax=Hyalella azteca TaxID=294128 RepID=A0A6A0GP10_HYAAZ|nr:hypothetical protein HAZT_HAZT010852 [Hyalella azteca]